MRFSFAGPMLDLLPLEIIPIVLIIHTTGTEVALTPRYTFATTLSIGNEDWCFSLVVFEFRRNSQRQVMIDFSGCCIGC